MEQLTAHCQHYPWGSTTIAVPWLLFLPILAAFVIPLSGSIGPIPLLAAGLLLLVVGYLVLPLVLGRRHPGRVGAATAFSVLLVMFLEGYIMFHLLAPFASGDRPHGWPVFCGYLLLAVVVAILPKVTHPAASDSTVTTP